MGTIWRTADRALWRDIAAIGLAIGVVGVSFGAIAVAAGLPAWAVGAMSVMVFAGGSQFLAAGLLAAGSPVGALLGGLLLNARHLPFGFALRDRHGRQVLGPGWLSRLLGSHLMVDEAIAFALAQPSPQRRRAAYWLTGGTLFVTWNIGTWAGIGFGSVIADPAAFGLDAAFPAGLLALLWPSLRDPAARRVALVGAGVALATTPWLPVGAPVLLAVAGLVAAGRPRPRTPPADPPRRHEPGSSA